jgi:predicted MFS family arabinose efflux permease
MMEDLKNTTLSGNEATMIVANIDDSASPHPHQPEKSPTQDVSNEEPPYTILSNREKIFTIILASFAAFISPVSSSIYLPALNPLAKDLNVTASTINISITVYIVVQGIAPTFIGSISDKNGRRPAFLICFVLYLGANIGLALQNSYPALLILRCLQASGSSESASTVLC